MAVGDVVALVSGLARKASLALGGGFLALGTAAEIMQQYGFPVDDALGMHHVVVKALCVGALVTAARLFRTGDVFLKRLEEKLQQDSLMRALGTERAARRIAESRIHEMERLLEELAGRLPPRGG